MFRIHGAMKDYDWGRVDGLVQWSVTPTGAPQAELWFGAHPSGPSVVIDDGTTLDHVGIDIPVLVKILAAAQPLSVQVHPTADIAQEQWEIQKSGGEQVYSDTAEKAELLVALEPFTAFAGWRDIDQAADMLNAIDGTAPVTAALRSGDVQGALSALLRLGETADIAMLISRMPEAAAAAGLPEVSRAVYRTVASMYPSDPGALVTCLLRDVHLAPGGSIFVPAGVPHSYVSGLAIEVMTSSDNVVRLGLTSKPVYVEHALRALVPDAEPTITYEPKSHIQTPAGFQVSFIQHGSGQADSGMYRLILAIEGACEVTVADESVELAAGEAVAIAAHEAAAHVRTQGFCVVVAA
jgi:mannose-6-phosphate isomerase